MAAVVRGEIVSCDSLQVYRGFDIGSAKPTPEERRAVPHHMIDVASGNDVFSAADYTALARDAIAGIRSRGCLPIVAGGTGLYLRALLDGLFEGPSRRPHLRERLTSLAERYGDRHLHRVLRRFDASASARIAPADRVRVVRALEVYFTTGAPITEGQSRGARALDGFRVGVFGLDPGREELRRRVETRVRGMFEAGLVKEARDLRERHVGDVRALRSIGYRQALAILDGTMTEAEAERDIVVKTMRYAKRQMTWFRHQARATWFSDADSAARGIEAWLDPESKP